MPNLNLKQQLNYFDAVGVIKHYVYVRSELIDPFEPLSLTSTPFLFNASRSTYFGVVINDR